jgi:hypothetical protein
MEGRAVGQNFERDPPRDHPWSFSGVIHIKMSSNFNCSYMTMNSLTYILGFSVKFFQPVYSI